MIRGPSRGLRRAVVAGAALAALGPGLSERHANARPRHLEPTKHELRIDTTERREMRDFITPEERVREEFRFSLERAKKAGQDKVEKRIEETTLRMLKRFESGNMTQKEAQELATRINAELKEIDPSGKTRIASGPEIKKMGLVEDASSIPEGVWGLIMGAAENLNRHYILVPLAELIVLYSYLQVARNARRRGFFKGIIENDANRAHLGDVRDLSKIEQFGVLPLMGLYLANHHVAGIILGLIANPAVRAKVAGLIRDFNNRKGGGGGFFKSPGTPDPRDPSKRILNTGRPIAGTRPREQPRRESPYSRRPRQLREQEDERGPIDKAMGFIYKGDKEEPTASGLRDDWHDRTARVIDRLTGFDPKKKRGRN